MGEPAVASDRGWSLGGVFRGSRYPPSTRRDDRIDLLRGLFVAVMVLNHIGGWSPIRWITGDAEFYVSAAEGFVCISGYIFGTVYRRTLEMQGPKKVLARAVRRAFVLYVAMLATTAVLGACGLAAGLEWAPKVHGVGDFALFMFRVATFQIMFRVTRILGVYAILVLAGALGVLLLARGALRFLLAASWSLYAFYQIAPRRFGWPFPEEAYFHPYAYQALFLTLVVLGYHRDRLVAFFDGERQKKLYAVSLTAFVALITLHMSQHASLPERVDWVLDRVFYRDYLRPGRLAATALIAPTFYLTVTYFWQPIHRHLGGLFMPLGRRSLYAYVMHVPFVALFERLALSFETLGRWAPLLNAGSQLAVLAALCAMVRFRILFRLFPR